MTTPNWKDARGTFKRKRRSRKTRLQKNESKAKLESKLRDTMRCRFPRCRCRQGDVESSHLKHKSMGGNPTGDRSTPDMLMSLCAHRHRTGRISRDAGTMRYTPLTHLGCNGPVLWEVDLAALPNSIYPKDSTGHCWFELAVETEIGKIAPLSRQQDEILTYLSTMMV